MQSGRMLVASSMTGCGGTEGREGGGEGGREGGREGG